MSDEKHSSEETPESDSLSKLLLRLQLPYIRAHYHELAQTAVEQQWGHLEYLQHLIEAEVARREDKSLVQRIRRARFPLTKTLDQFQWNWPKRINRPQIQNLFRLNFIEQKSNAIFLGGVGLGKTHLCIALGHAACVRGYSVLFATAIDIIHTLSAATATGSLKRTMQRYLKPKLLVVDELGYLPIDKLGADLLFQIISERYERGAILMSTPIAPSKTGQKSSTTTPRSPRRCSIAYCTTPTPASLRAKATEPRTTSRTRDLGVRISRKEGALKTVSSYPAPRPVSRLLNRPKSTALALPLTHDAKHGKALRGDLRISVPIGYVWHREMGLGLDPNLRVQEAVRVVFARFRQLGSARQVLLSLTAEQMHFPRPSDGRTLVSFDWTVIRYRNVISILKNPFYAGAYAYGKSEKRTALVDGRVRTTYKHRKPFERWAAIIRDHHEGYIEWSEFERNQKLLAANAYGKADGVKSARGGRALLAGLLLCGSCGCRLVVAYSGHYSSPIYRCERPHQSLGRPRCLTFGAKSVDTAIGRELLLAVEPLAIEAVLHAEHGYMEQQSEQRRIVELELQQARYDASLAERRYAACDPDNRLIAAQLDKELGGDLAARAEL